MFSVSWRVLKGSSVDALLSVAKEMSSASSSLNGLEVSSMVVDGGLCSEVGCFPAFLLLLRLPSAVQ